MSGVVGCSGQSRKKEREREDERKERGGNKENQMAGSYREVDNLSPRQKQARPVSEPCLTDEKIKKHWLSSLPPNNKFTLFPTTLLFLIFIYNCRKDKASMGPMR